jgi:hypothetical protein
MEPWAVSARASLTPLAVLVPILATVVGAFWAFTVFPPLALLVIAGGLAVTAYAGRPTYGARRSVAAAGCTLLVCPVVFIVSYVVAINTSICGKNMGSGWTALACVLGALIFFALGSLGVRNYHAAWVTPMALVAGVLGMLLVLAVAPGTPGFCET